MEITMLYANKEWVKGARYSLSGRLVGPHSRSGRFMEESSVPLPGFEPRTIQATLLRGAN
jgi:hypothetical protein